MIGIFDSGFGGLTILKEIERILPEYSFIYLGDNDRAPYGSKNADEIYNHTVECVEKLFLRGAELVILACNTSSAVALRKIQQEFLPAKYPDKKVLGIIIPTAQESKKFSKAKHIGIWATEATVNSEVYLAEILKIDPQLKITQIACPLLVPIIESGKVEDEKLNVAIKKYIDELLGKDDEIDTLILGCTHYPIIEKQIKKLLPENIKIIIQGKIVAEKLKQYFVDHSEIEQKLEKQQKRIFLTTKKSDEIKKLAELFYGESINLEVIKLM